MAAKEHKDNKGNSPVQNGPVNNELKAVREAMFQALEERDATLAGTALIGLENLSRTHDEFDRELITSKAVEITIDESGIYFFRLFHPNESQTSVCHTYDG